MNCFAMLKKYAVRTGLYLSIVMLCLVLAKAAFSKSGTITINSPANNSTFTSNFSISVYAPIWWNNGVLSNGDYDDYTFNGCNYVSVYPKLDFYWTGSKDVIGKLVYSIDGNAPVTVQELYPDSGADFSVNIDISSLTVGSHSVTVSTNNVYSSMNKEYYLDGSATGANCSMSCSATGCHVNPNTSKFNAPWVRQDGLALASATRTFTKGVPAVTTAPGLLSPGNRSFVSPNLIFSDNVAYQWSAVANATSYQLVMYETNDQANTTKSIPVQTTTYNTNSDSSIVLKRGRKYSWKVQGVNSQGGGPFSEIYTFIIGSAECWPEVGTGTGHDHIDTCYDLNSNPEVYRLKDISRRTNMNIDGHKGDMGDTRAIISQVGSVTAGALSSSTNNWTAGGTQKKAIDAHVNTGKVYDYFYDPLLNPLLDRSTTPRRFSRNSFDGSGSSMVTIVENPDAPCGTESACFVSIDNTVNFTPGSTDSGAVDIIAHEWAHAITSTTSRLGSTKELGALNEAFSDWMAIAHKQARGNASWEVIQGNNSVLRNVADPTLSNPPQPVIYKKSATWTNIYSNTPNWWETDTCTPTLSNDDCQVHYNAGVSNKMFYLLSSGGNNYEVDVQGLGITRAMQIAFRANTTKWQTIFNYSDANEKMVLAAQDLSATTHELNQIKNAWAAVGVGNIPAISTTRSNPLAGKTFAYRENAQLLTCTPATPAITACIAGKRYQSSCCSYETYHSVWGKKVTVEAIPNLNYNFLNWTENEVVVSSSPKYTFTVTGDSSLLANFSTDPPAISVEAPLGDFLSVSTGATSPEHSFIVNNGSSQTLSISTAQITGANSGEFSLTSNGCSGQNLAPAASCAIQVRFAPTAEGAKTATLAIPSTDPNTPAYVIALSGIAGKPVMTSSVSGYNVTNYSTIQTAYNNAVSGDEIRLWAADFNETLNLNRTITTSIRGGYDGGFADQVGKSSLQGSLTISSGTVVIDGLQIGGSSYQSALSVVVDLPGAGRITSSPAGINCNASCSSPFINGDLITLTAVPVGDSVFTGWSGGGCSGTGSCRVAMTGDINVKALFLAAKISVAPAANSLGNVFVGRASTPKSITVTSNGTKELIIGTLSLSGLSASEFNVTEDYCSGQTLTPSASCSFKVSFAPAFTGAKTASLLIPSNDPQTPVFDVSLNGIGTLPTLSISQAGGLGTITSSPTGIDCGSSCSADYNLNTPVSLTVIPNHGYTFTSWGGACSGANTCAVVMNDNISVIANFERIPLSVCSGYPAAVGSSYYSTIQEAYNSAADNAVIKLLAIEFTDSFITNRDIYVIIDGGYLCDFETYFATTVLHGVPYISEGTVKLRDIRIAQ